MLSLEGADRHPMRLESSYENDLFDPCDCPIGGAVKPAFHDTDILARIVARMSVSASWNAGLNRHTLRLLI